MQTIYRPKVIRYVDSTGKRVTAGTPGARRKDQQSKTWRAKYTDVDGRIKTVSLRTEDQREAQERLGDLLRRMREREGDPFAEHREKPLRDHVADFLRHLEAKNSSPKHVDKVGSYLARVLDWCGFVVVSDLDANAVADYLYQRRQTVPVTLLSLKQAAEIIAEATGQARPPLTQVRRLSRSDLPEPTEQARRGFAARWNWATLRPVLQREFNCGLPRQCPLPDEPGMSVAASNDYIACVKNFANWMVRSRRMPESPFRHLAKLNAETDPRHQRRPVDPADFSRLLTATANGKSFRGLTGPDRAMLYLVATTTGFRASELASLTEASFDLDAEVPAVKVKATRSDDVLIPSRCDRTSRRYSSLTSAKPRVVSNRPTHLCGPEVGQTRPQKCSDETSLPQRFRIRMAKAGSSTSMHCDTRSEPTSRRLEFHQRLHRN